MQKGPVLSRYRPRVATLLVLLAIGTLLVLANLTDELHPRRAPQVLSEADVTFDVRVPPDSHSIWWPALSAASSGWPLLWKQYVFQRGYGMGVIAWRYSAGRLICDLVMWLLMLAAPAAACEWALRRYRPRLRFSLRGMLAAVSVVAAFCGWFAWARHRADTEDEIIDAVEDAQGDVWLERWGPKWLDLIDADRYRRRVVAARVFPILDDDGDQDDEATSELLSRLSSLPALQYLFVDAEELTPDLARALRGFRQLRMLSITSEQSLPGACEALGEALGGMYDLHVLVFHPGEADAWIDNEDTNYESGWYRKKKARMWQECLAAIRKATSLERLRLENITLRSESLACLAGLTRLKSLSLLNVERAGNEPNPPPLLSSLPSLASLEAFEADSEGMKLCDLVDDDVRYLASQPHLKSLRLSAAALSEAGLAQLTSLNSLEELSLTGALLLSSSQWESLVRLEHLSKLHIPLEHTQPDEPNGPGETVPHVFSGDLRASVRALQTLRQTHPGIVIDDNFNALAWYQSSLLPAGVDTRERRQDSWVQPAINAWNKAGCPPIPAPKPAPPMPAAAPAAPSPSAVPAEASP